MGQSTKDFDDVSNMLNTYMKTNFNAEPGAVSKEDYALMEATATNKLKHFRQGKLPAMPRIQCVDERTEDDEPVMLHLLMPDMYSRSARNMLFTADEWKKYLHVCVRENRYRS